MLRVGPVYDEIERLVLAGAVCRVQLRPDVFRELVREVQASAWGTHVNEGPTWAVRVGDVIVTPRNDKGEGHGTGIR